MDRTPQLFISGKISTAITGDDLNLPDLHKLAMQSLQGEAGKPQHHAAPRYWAENDTYNQERMRNPELCHSSL